MEFVSAEINKIIEKEGGFVDHPSDKGGPTRYGITQGTARSWGYFGKIEELPRDTAVAIYTDRFYLRPGINRIAVISPDVAAEVFDSGVNCGPGTAVIWLQKWLNGMNRQQKDYPDLLIDGNIGDTTARALAAYIKKRGEKGVHVLVGALNCSQGAYYLEITKREANEDFLYGWIANRINL